MARLNGRYVFTDGLMRDVASLCCGAAVRVFGNGNIRCDYCAEQCEASADYLPMGADKAQTRAEMLAAQKGNG